MKLETNNRRTDHINEYQKLHADLDDTFRERMARLGIDDDGYNAVLTPAFEGTMVEHERDCPIYRMCVTPGRWMTHSREGSGREVVEVKMIDGVLCEISPRSEYAEPIADAVASGCRYVRKLDDAEVV